MMLERGYTRCRFGQLHFLAGGRRHGASAPPLVLLHQNPSSSLEYSRFAEAMAEDRYVIAFDTPGNGMSDAPHAPPSLAEYAGAFADGLDALGLGTTRKADVLGFHTGTYLAAELALARPDIVGRLILSGIPFRPPEQRAPRLAAALTPMALSEDGEAVFAFARSMWAFSVQGRDRRTSIERAVAIFAERLRPMQRHAWPYIGVWSYEAESRLPRITQPVLVLQPHEALLEHSRAAAALMPHAKLIEFAELDKDVFENGIADFARAIREW